MNGFDEAKRFSVLLFVISGEIIEKLEKHFGTTGPDSAKILYDSEVYSILEREDTKLWHLGAHALFHCLLEELETGTAVLPEGVS